MKRRAAVIGSLAGLAFLVSCAGSRGVWTPLSPMDARSDAAVQRAEKTQGKVTVSAELLESGERYLARIEIRNDGRQAVHGPEGVVLVDDGKEVHQALDADSLKSEIGRRAESEASYARSFGSFGPHYYYRPRRVYYGRGRSRYVYVGPYVRDDWFERQIEADRILRRAERRIAAIDAEYLRAQDIPAGSTLKGFVQFPRAGLSRNVSLSLKAGKKTYRFEFVSAATR
jgi:hypothetical protein